MSAPDSFAQSQMADYATAVTGAAVVAVSWLDLIDYGERVFAGALVIFLLLMRIRSHLRRDRADRLAGRQ